MSIFHISSVRTFCYTLYLHYAYIPISIHNTLSTCLFACTAPNALDRSIMNTFQFFVKASLYFPVLNVDLLILHYYIIIMCRIISVYARCIREIGNFILKKNQVDYRYRIGCHYYNIMTQHNMLNQYHGIHYTHYYRVRVAWYFFLTAM